jgi:hypothetical protein
MSGSLSFRSLGSAIATASAAVIASFAAGFGRLLTVGGGIACAGLAALATAFLAGLIAALALLALAYFASAHLVFVTSHGEPPSLLQ